MIVFVAHFLFVLAAWTVTVKFAFPVAFALAEGSPAATYVYWDFWWVVHIWLGRSLLDRGPRTWRFALVVSVIEIGIIVTKFVLFLAEPTWTMWTTNWFVNKIFVLACFVILLGVLVARRSELERR